MTDVEERKNREQMGLETPVVYSVNNECSYLEYHILDTKLTREALHLRSIVARLELKGIDGGLYKWWSMWFNAIIRAKSYQLLIF